MKSCLRTDFFWSPTTEAEEVDLLVEQGGRFVAIECEYGEQVGQSIQKGVDALMKSYGSESLIAGYMAFKTSRRYPFKNKISSVPGSFIDRVL